MPHGGAYGKASNERRSLPAEARRRQGVVDAGELS